ncbi:hypothetical protein ABZ897_57900 [Nonomuraea sp. NPDC046802]|uniref:hypothetical protein n=1 Tax=Nonomuraea sp. NPDC046802 TaxID=3154919 RepID=UPI0033DB931B
MMAWTPPMAASTVKTAAGRALKLTTNSGGGTDPLRSVAALSGVVVWRLLMVSALRPDRKVALAGALWSGTAAAAIAVLGGAAFEEHLGPVRMLSLTLIIAVVVLLSADRPIAATAWPMPSFAGSAHAVAGCLRDLGHLRGALPALAPAVVPRLSGLSGEPTAAVPAGGRRIALWP